MFFISLLVIQRMYNTKTFDAITQRASILDSQAMTQMPWVDLQDTEDDLRHSVERDLQIIIFRSRRTLTGSFDRY